MKIVKAVNLKKYFVTENYEVHAVDGVTLEIEDRKSTRLNSSHNRESRMPSSA